MGHRETYEHYYRGMDPGSSHEDAYHMEDTHPDGPCGQSDTCRFSGCPDYDWYRNVGVLPMEDEQCVTEGCTNLQDQPNAHGWCMDCFNKLYPLGSKAEHDLLGCERLSGKLCRFCYPWWYRAYQKALAFADVAVGDLAYRLRPTWDWSDGKQRCAGPFPWYRSIPGRFFSELQQQIARKRHPISDYEEEIPF